MEDFSDLIAQIIALVGLSLGVYLMFLAKKSAEVGSASDAGHDIIGGEADDGHDDVTDALESDDPEGEIAELLNEIGP